MKLHRFFIDDEIVGDTYVIQDEPLIHQITRVLRLRIGESLVLCTSDGLDYISEIHAIDKKYVEVRVLDTRRTWIPATTITLYCAQIRKELFELVLQKATEIGVSAIVPLETERTERGAVSPARAEKIIREAAEQCGRGDVPTLKEACSLGELVSRGQQDECLIMFDMDGTALPASLSQTFPIGVLIGPEGGWSPAEKRLLADHNCAIYTLGPTTLRAETAAIVACSAVVRAVS